MERHKNGKFRREGRDLRIWREGLTGVSEGEGRTGMWQKEVFVEIVTKTFPNLMKGISQTVPYKPQSRINIKKPIRGHILEKNTENQNKEKISLYLASGWAKYHSLPQPPSTEPYSGRWKQLSPQNMTHRAMAAFFHSLGRGGGWVRTGGAKVRWLFSW